MTHYLRVLGAAIVMIALPGCILESDRCDAHQHRVGGHDFALCVCDDNAVFNASGVGCSPCGENEVVSNNLCTCREGFAKPAADAGCMASSIGAACNVGTPCSAEFPYCVMTSPTDGYCSKQGCSTNADCGGDFSCESGGTMRYCKRAPSGFGSPCTTDSDCASFEANYCETLQQHTCIIQGCAQGSATCPNEWACCDYSALASILGKVFSVCAPPGMLQNGSCPAPGVRVTP